MMFFNFNRIFGGFASQLDTILEKPDITLESILDEDILSELKVSGGAKFGGFVTKSPQTFERMIRYVIECDEKNPDTRTQIRYLNESFRYPFMVSEVFASENIQLIDYFFEGDRNLAQYEEHESLRVNMLSILFSFLESDSLNLTSAGYFSKVVLALIRRRGYDLLEFVQQRHILSNLMKHLDVFHIAEIVEKLIILDTQQEEGLNTYLKLREELLQRVINVMSYKQHQHEIVDNCSMIVTEVCTKTENKFYEQIYKPFKFFGIALTSGNASVVNLLINMLETIGKLIKQEEENKGVQIQFEYSPFAEICTELPKALGVEKIQISSFRTTYGETITPFSMTKLRMIYLYQALLKTQDAQIIQYFANFGVYKNLLDFLIRYPFNNQLQNIFYDITSLIFGNDIYKPIQAVLIENGFFDFIATHNHHEKNQVGSMNKTIKQGYFGVLTKLSNSIKDKAPRTALWVKYEEEVLNKINKVEGQYMLGVNPHQRPTYEEENVQEDHMRMILARIEHHKIEQNRIQQDDQTVQVEEIEEDDPMQDDDEEQQPEEEDTGKRNLMLDEEKLAQQLNEVVLSPKTSPNQVSEIIDQLADQSIQCKSPQEIDIKSDQTVNKYWKSHEKQQEVHIRKLSSDDAHKVQEQIEEEINFQDSVEIIPSLPPVKEPEEEPTTTVKQQAINEAVEFFDAIYQHEQDQFEKADNTEKVEIINQPEAEAIEQAQQVQEGQVEAQTENKEQI